MRKLELKRAWVSRTRNRAVLQPDELSKLDELIKANEKRATISTALSDFSKDFWKSILEESNLSSSIRTAIALHVFGMREGQCDLQTIYNLNVNDPIDFGNSLQLCAGSLNAELCVNGRWYPVVLSVEFLEDRDKIPFAVAINCILSVAERTFTQRDCLTRDRFTDENGNSVTRKVIDLLEKFGYRRLQTSATEYNLRLIRAERLMNESSKVVEVKNSVIVPAMYSWWKGFDSFSLGTDEMPSRCIVESDLEVDDNYDRYSYAARNRESHSHLPFVRLFSLETKSYVYADVDDIVEYEFDDLALSRLHLPNDMHSILRRVFETPVENIFGDLLKGKHGGVVVLASGSTGVGKTLTAEIYAETTQRPLYVLELGELGTTANEVEENLRKVFARVTRWNAVLQFDECEIFLAKRGNDLERSAIVGIFLRLLDYYRGLLFLTTNRPSVLDSAVLSRVMLRLEYPDLNPASRADIWATMFEMAELRLQGITFKQLGEHELNGRQIRNITRLAKILNPDGVLNADDVAEVLMFGTPNNSNQDHV